VLFTFTYLYNVSLLTGGGYQPEIPSLGVEGAIASGTALRAIAGDLSTVGISVMIREAIASGVSVAFTGIWRSASA
jgi:hypothetical protein